MPPYAAFLNTGRGAQVVEDDLVRALTERPDLTAYIFYTMGLKNTEPGKAAVMATFEAVVASLAGVLVFDEVLSTIAIIGIVLVLFSVFLLNRK